MVPAGPRHVLSRLYIYSSRPDPEMHYLSHIYILSKSAGPRHVLGRPYIYILVGRTQKCIISAIYILSKSAGPRHVLSRPYIYPSRPDPEMHYFSCIYYHSRPDPDMHYLGHVYNIIVGWTHICILSASRPLIPLLRPFVQAGGTRSARSFD